MPRSSSARGSRRTGFANGKPLNSGATGQFVHTDSTTKSATGTTAPEAQPIPPLTQAEKAREEQKTGRQTVAMGTAAALIRHIYQRGSGRL